MVKILQHALARYVADAPPEKGNVGKEMMMKSQWIVLLVVLLLAGCATYKSQVTSEPPGVKIEVDGDLIGQTPTEIEWPGCMPHQRRFKWGDFHVIKALPTQPGQYVQNKFISGGDRVPKNIYFDMNLGPANPKTEIDVHQDINHNINIREQ